MSRDGRLGLHFEAIGQHGIHWPQHAVKAGQNAESLLQVGERRVFEHFRRHVLVLNALIGEQRGRVRLSKCHLRETGHIFCGQLVIAAPERLQLRIRARPEPGKQFLGLRKILRQMSGRYAVSLHAHLFRRRDEYLHASSPSISAGFSAGFTFSKPFTMMPCSSIK